MAQVRLTNLLTNGGFEAATTGWTANVGTLSRVSKSPTHSEFGSYAGSLTGKAQSSGGGLYATAATIACTANHIYYIRGLLQPIRTGTTGNSTITDYAVISNSATGNPVPPLVQGLSTYNVGVWTMCDALWKPASNTNLALRINGQGTANQGNNNLQVMFDNVMVIDLTQDCGVGQEPPILAIRYAVDNYIQKGHWDGLTPAPGVTIPPAPVFDTQSIVPASKDREYLQQIDLVQNSGTAPFSFSLSNLPLGHGLSISNTGEMSGICELSDGIYNFDIIVTDVVGYMVSKQYTLSVHEPPDIRDDYIPGAVLNEPYLFTPDVTGSDGNLMWTIQVTHGTLPTGLLITQGSKPSITGTGTVTGQECQITILAYNDYDLVGVAKVYTFGVYSVPKINTISPLPLGIKGQPYQLQYSASGLPPIEYELRSGLLPDNFTLSNTGLLSGTSQIPGTYSFSVRAFNSFGYSATILYTLNIYELPVIITTSFGYARLGLQYSGQLLASGSPDITYRIISGSIPIGMSLDENTGKITGLALVPGTYTFQVIAVNPAGSSAPKTFQIEVGSALGITTTSPLPIGKVGVAYTPLTFQAAGIDNAYSVSWSMTAEAGSSIPSGYTLSTAGVLSGTSNNAGTYRLLIKVTNGTSTSTSPFTLVIGAPPVIISSPNLTGGVDRPFLSVIESSGSSGGPYTYSMTAGPTFVSGPKPPPQMIDINLNSNGVVDWYIPTEGLYSFTVKSTDIFGDSAPVVFYLLITTPSIVDVLLPYGIVDEYYEHIFEASGEPPFTWSMPSSSLISGLHWDSAQHKIYGTPKLSGVATFDLKVEGIGGYAEETFNIDIYQRPEITTPSLSSGNVNSYYSQIIHTIGTTPVTISVLPSGQGETGLPPGTALIGSTISGTPNTQGTYIFTLQGQNLLGVGYADTKQYTIVIGPSGAPVIMNNVTLSNIIGQSFSLNLTATGNPTIVFSLDSGSVLPDGLSLVNGVISGVTITGGVTQFLIIATNGSGTDSRWFTFIVQEPPTITTLSLPNGVVGESYYTEIETIGDLPIILEIMYPGQGETDLPDGLSFNPYTGIISGIPTIICDTLFRIRAINAAGDDIKSFTISIKGSEGATGLDGYHIKNLCLDNEEILYGCIDGKLVYRRNSNLQ